MRVLIKDRVVGDHMPCYIVAEIGLNHNGDINVARRLIEEAAKVGVDAVKFQKRSIDDIMISEYLDKPYAGYNSYGATYREHRVKLELPDNVWPALRDFAQSRGVHFFFCLWDEKSADFLADLDTPAFKIASADLTNLPLLKRVAAKGKPVILSTGMSTMEEVDEAVAAVTAINPQLVLLHCVSTYPFDDHLANLQMIRVLAKRFPQTVVGYSGHEKSGHVISVVAAALGARMVERHFTLDRTMKGPDHAASLEPHGMAQVVEDIRKAELAVGNGEKAVLESELPIRGKLAKSIVAKLPIKHATVICAEMLTVKSPGTGLKPKYIENICGRVASQDIPADTLVPGDALQWPIARTRQA